MRKKSLLFVVLAALVLIMPLAAQADFVFDSYNETFSPGPYYWAQPSGKIGWSWTPSTNVLLTGISTTLTTGFNNINNNFLMTVTVFTDRPAVGGTAIDFFQFNPQNSTGGSFSSPLSLTGGTMYFIGFSGWDQVLTGSGGGGVNWVDVAPFDPLNPQPPGIQFLYPGYTGDTWEIKMNILDPFQIANIDCPIMEFFATNPTPPAPLPGTLLLVSSGLTGLMVLRRKFF